MIRAIQRRGVQLKRNKNRIINIEKGTGKWKKEIKYDR